MAASPAAPPATTAAAPTASCRELPSSGLIELGDGERVISITAGGGGYGPPQDRDPAAVRRDVAEGWITGERAREVYGVEAGE